jgi:hypothetical protein
MKKNIRNNKTDKKKNMKKKGKKNPTIYHTQEGHANNYTTDDVLHGKC